MFEAGIATSTFVDILEWAGSLSGLLGAFLLATHTQISRYGWIAFFAANMFTAAFAYAIDRNGLLLQQVGFIFTSLLGLYRAGFLSFITPGHKRSNHASSHTR